MSPLHQVYRLVLISLLTPFDEVSYCSCRQVNRFFADFCLFNCREAAIITQELTSLPPFLSKLTIVMDISLDNDLLPSTLNHLYLLGSFNQPLTNSSLPRNLRTLVIGRHYRKSFDILDLPTTLQTLKLHYKKEEKILDFSRLSCLQKLRVVPSCRVKNLPNTLNSLHVRSHSSHETLPPSLRRLIYDKNRYLRQFSVTDLPINLQVFHSGKLDSTYLNYYSLEGLPCNLVEFVDLGAIVTTNSLPNTLRKLHVNYCNYFPSSLTSLSCVITADGEKYNHDRSSRILSSNLPRNHQQLQDFLKGNPRLQKLSLALDETVEIASLLPSSLRTLELDASCETIDPSRFPLLKKLVLENFGGQLITTYPSSLKKFSYHHSYHHERGDFSLPRNLLQLSVDYQFSDLRLLSETCPDLEVLIDQCSAVSVFVDELPRGLRELDVDVVQAKNWLLFPRHLQDLETNSASQINCNFLPGGLRRLVLYGWENVEFSQENFHQLPLLELVSFGLLEKKFSDILEQIGGRRTSILNQDCARYTRQRRLRECLHQIDALISQHPGELSPTIIEERKFLEKYGTDLAFPELLAREVDHYRLLLANLK